MIQESLSDYYVFIFFDTLSRVCISNTNVYISDQFQLYLRYHFFKLLNQMINLIDSYFITPPESSESSSVYL